MTAGETRNSPNPCYIMRICKDVCYFHTLQEYGDIIKMFAVSIRTCIYIIWRYHKDIVYFPMFQNILPTPHTNDNSAMNLKARLIAQCVVTWLVVSMVTCHVEVIEEEEDFDYDYEDEMDEPHTRTLKKPIPEARNPIREQKAFVADKEYVLASVLYFRIVTCYMWWCSIQIFCSYLHKHTNMEQ